MKTYSYLLLVNWKPNTTPLGARRRLAQALPSHSAEQDDLQVPKTLLPFRPYQQSFEKSACACTPSFQTDLKVRFAYAV